MNIHDEIIYEMATTLNEVRLEDLYLQVTLYFLEVYNDEINNFSKKNNVDEKNIDDELLLIDYGSYLYQLLVGMRSRVDEKKNELIESKSDKLEDELRQYIVVQFQNILDTEYGNSRQLAQLSVVKQIISENSAVKITKTWNAHPDCCVICDALNGTTIPIDEPFLVDGQVIPLASGKEFIYDYIDRDVAIAHPNDRCWIEFNIEY